MKALPFLAALFLACAALAHGPHKWVQEGNYRSVVDGSPCCNEHDCHHLDPRGVRLIAGRWFFEYDGQQYAVPAGEVQWGEDGQYSACIWGGKVRCFFVPPDGA